MKRNHIYITSLLLCSVVLLSALGTARAQQSQLARGEAGEQLETADLSLQAVPYTYGLYTITEGMRDYPIKKQLANAIPLSFDLSVIFVIGWTGDKLFIKVQDELDYGDRIIGIAVAQYGNGMMPYFNSLYSSASNNTFEIIIPVYQPGITVYLLTGYWGKSLGANPYSYKITLSYPK